MVDHIGAGLRQMPYIFRLAFESKIVLKNYLDCHGAGSGTPAGTFQQSTTYTHIKYRTGVFSSYIGHLGAFKEYGVLSSWWWIVVLQLLFSSFHLEFPPFSNVASMERVDKTG